MSCYAFWLMAKSPSELMLIYNSAIFFFFCKNALSLLSYEPQKSDLPGQEMILCGFELKFHQEIVCYALHECNKLLLKPMQLSSNLGSVGKKWLIVCVPQLIYIKVWQVPPSTKVENSYHLLKRCQARSQFTG